MCYYIRRRLLHPTPHIGDFPTGLRLYAYCFHPFFSNHFYQIYPRDERDCCKTGFVLWPGIAEPLGVGESEICTMIEGVNFFPPRLPTMGEGWGCPAGKEDAEKQQEKETGGGSTGEGEKDMATREETRAEAEQEGC